MAARVGIVLFPGTTAEAEVVEAVTALGGAAEILRHDRTDLGAVDAVILPGGAAHGDALRPGAIAARSPILGPIGTFAADGGPVLGIGNGFQILTEAGLLPGAFLPNRGGRFLATTVEVRVGSTDSPITGDVDPDAVLQLPIAHGHGSYHLDADDLETLQAEDRVVLRYVDDPNGSVGSIAGIVDATRNVVGVMVRPERAISPLLGSEDGLPLLSSLLRAASVASTP